MNHENESLPLPIESIINAVFTSSLHYGYQASDKSSMINKHAARPLGPHFCLHTGKLHADV